MKIGGFDPVGFAKSVIVAVIVFIFAVVSCQGRNLRVHVRSQEGRTPGVTLRSDDNHLIMDNGLLQVTIAVPQGYVTGVSFNGVDNLLETDNKHSDRGYWDIVWDAPGRCSKNYCTDRLIGTAFEIISQSNNRVEVSFSSKWHPALWNLSEDNQQVPFNIDRRYVMVRGLSGFYSYSILERGEGWPEINVYQIRAVYKLDRDMFHYMAISEERQRTMPMPQDRDNGEPLAYGEAVRLTNPIYGPLKGEVDDKYQYSSEYKDIKVHGWISSQPSVGFWLITPSSEFRSGGPVKQDLTSHTGPISLAMFHSSHYAGPDIRIEFREGEPWKKVFGPFFVYLNSAPDDHDHQILWKDAKTQMEDEVAKWPYEFPASENFPKPRHRSSLSGRLLVNDRYISDSSIPANSSWVGLAARGEPGSWQRETKGYQFWTKADGHGSFKIKGVRAGTYNLYAFVPGFIGDYKYENDIRVLPGQEMELGDLVFEPLRNGPTLWEIGYPDRSAAEFYIPDPDPKLSNSLYVHKIHDKFRQYGLWDRYTELYPTNDLVYTVGEGDYRRDWFFAQVTRRVNNTKFKPTTWQVKFPLAAVDHSANYTLRLALAAAHKSDVQVRFNNPNRKPPHFITGGIGEDNAIARHGAHGLYWLFNVAVRPSWLHRGMNTIFLTQSKSQNQFQGVMYDYIRLEGPPDRI